jgi:hypothetical protein
MPIIHAAAEMAHKERFPRRGGLHHFGGARSEIKLCTRRFIYLGGALFVFSSLFVSLFDVHNGNNNTRQLENKLIRAHRPEGRFLSQYSGVTKRINAIWRDVKIRCERVPFGIIAALNAKIKSNKESK